MGLAMATPTLQPAPCTATHLLGHDILGSRIQQGGMCAGTVRLIQNPFLRNLSIPLSANELIGMARVLQGGRLKEASLTNHFVASGASIRRKVCFLVMCFRD